MPGAPRMKATRKMYLECPYAEKDACKAEGGRFDGELRKWYVPVGAELGRFRRWLASGVGTAPTTRPSETGAAALKRPPPAHGTTPAAKKRLCFSDAAQLPGPARRCVVHNRDLVLRTVRKEGANRGRQFYCCPQETPECKQQGSWQWANDAPQRGRIPTQPVVAASSRGSLAAVSHTSTPQHVPRRSHEQNLHDSQRARAAVMKAAPADWICGVHGCHLSKGPFTARNGEEHNVGRKFYLCPRKSPRDDCSLRGGFRWADGARPFSDFSCRIAEQYHGLRHNSVGVGIAGIDGQPLPR